MKLYKRHKFPSAFKVSCAKCKYLSIMVDIYKSKSECEFEIASYIECYKHYSISKNVSVYCNYTHSNTRLYEIKHEI